VGGERAARTGSRERSTRAAGLIPTVIAASSANQAAPKSSTLAMELL
jgi:hypothetical protein